MGKKNLNPEKMAELDRYKNLCEQARMLNYSGVPYVLIQIAQEALPSLIELAEE